ncbi:hypothetical protein AYI69_g9663 [Smittium culicis]|uniref:Uncharacterized protein n=1 Tax=Smittium culicis TaxID=133412 RepID=A0A1R1XB92_9FUNG|nr:hypothetical protein AYI69_g9663 [Smittium culicis]
MEIQFIQIQDWSESPNLHLYYEQIAIKSRISCLHFLDRSLGKYSGCPVKSFYRGLCGLFIDPFKTFSVLLGTLAWQIQFSEESLVPFLEEISDPLAVRNSVPC